MKILKYTKLKNNQYKLDLDNGIEVKLYDDVILKENLLLTKELTNKQLDKIIELNDYYVAYYKALKLINIKLRSEKEIRENLKKTFTDDVIRDVIKTLKKEGYLDSKTYINSYIHDALILSLKGPEKIKKELLTMNFKEEEIDELFNVEDKVWEERIDKYLQKKIKLTNNLSALKFKQKIMSDLSYLGYNNDMILDRLSKVELPSDKNNLEKDYYKIKAKLERKNMPNSNSRVIEKLLQKGYRYEDIKSVVKEITEMQ